MSRPILRTRPREMVNRGGRDRFRCVTASPHPLGPVEAPLELSIRIGYSADPKVHRGEGEPRYSPRCLWPSPEERTWTQLWKLQAQPPTGRKSLTLNSRQSGSGRVYLSVGRVYYTYGPGRWGASHVADDGIFLVPQVNARNTFGWKQVSPDSWTSTMRSGVSGHDRVIVYQMRRITP